MTGAGELSSDARTVTVRVPLNLRRRGGRKLIIASEAAQTKLPKRKPDDIILKGLGCAYRWKRLLETGEFASIGDLAAAEKINHAYIRRILRLTVLSPELTEAILNDRMPRHVQLEDLHKPIPIEWAMQHDRFI